MIDINDPVLCKVMETLPSEARKFELPSEPCLNCYIAEWIDMYGVYVYCCDMAHCVLDDELY